MEYVVVGICIVAVLAIVALLTYRGKRVSSPEGEDKSDKDNGTIITKQTSELSQSDQKLNELAIQMETLPAEAIPDESSLVEITDSKVLARVNNLVPGLAQAGVAGTNAVQAAKAGNEVLYRAIIPAGAKLTNSQAMEGAVRGFYRGADGIQGHANLVAVQAQKGTAVVANTAAAAMGVASMVVGQYYMTQINAELGEISDGISKISDFQDNEF
ncbi:MAG: topoisomerase IV, partial [Hornefia butyriciproducens]|nr:topoisomerase IV [Hornefia butyriciproducens]